MESKEEPNSYGEWAIRRVQQEAGEIGNPLPAEVITAARMVWPRVAAVVVSELRREGSGREAEALAADIWEGVLRSVAKALHRKSDSGSIIRDFEPYLLAAFQHRFHRFQRAERGRRDRFQTASAGLDLGLVEGVRDTEWVLGARARNYLETNNRPDGPMDKKGLAGTTIWLFVERDSRAVRLERASGKEEIRVWIGEDKATDCSLVQVRNAQGTCLRPRDLRSSGSGLESSEWRNF